MIVQSQKKFCKISLVNYSTKWVKEVGLLGAPGRMHSLRKIIELFTPSGINLGPGRAITTLNPQVPDIEEVCYIIQFEISMR